MTLIATTPAAAGMHAWHCALLICLAGAAGGAVNAIISANGFVRPKLGRSIMCPGFLANLLVGAFAAFASWASTGQGLVLTLQRSAISVL